MYLLSGYPVNTKYTQYFFVEISNGLNISFDLIALR